MLFLIPSNCLLFCIVPLQFTLNHPKVSSQLGTFVHCELGSQAVSSNYSVQLPHANQITLVMSIQLHRLTKIRNDFNAYGEISQYQYFLSGICVVISRSIVIARIHFIGPKISQTCIVCFFLENSKNIFMFLHKALSPVVDSNLITR